MKTRLPLAMIFATGVFMALESFFDQPSVKVVKAHLTDWATIVLSFAYVLMLIEVARRELRRLVQRHHDPDWPFGLVLVGGMALMLGFGIIGGVEHPGFVWLYDYLYAPLQSSMLALLAFYLAGAALRAFRVRGMETGLLVAAALLVMLGRIPLGERIWSGLVDLEEWLINVPTVAGMRAIAIGAAIGAVSMALRVILGLEREFIGGGDA